MDKRIKALWLDALRSGEYVQGVDYLRNTYNEYCCLGVLCDLAAKAGIGEWANSEIDGWEFDYESGVLTERVRDWAGMTSYNGTYTDSEDGTVEQRCLSNDNDSGATFAEIVGIIQGEVDNL